MALSSIRSLSVVLICLLAFVGCNRSNTAEVTQAKADAEAARAEAQAARDELAKVKVDADAAKAELAKLKSTQAQPKRVDTDRRAADWVLRVDGSVKVLADGVPYELKKGEQLPNGQITLLKINLRNCPKATDDGREYLRGLTHLLEFQIDQGSGIRNFDFMADMTNLEVLYSESQGPCFSDKDLVHLKGLAKLKKLGLVSQLGNPGLTDNLLAVAKDLKQLEELHIGGSNITDAGLRHLEGHGALRTINLWRTKVGDTGLQSLPSLPKLEDVFVGETQVTDAGVRTFQAKLPKCQVRK